MYFLQYKQSEMIKHDMKCGKDLMFLYCDRLIILVTMTAFSNRREELAQTENKVSFRLTPSTNFIYSLISARKSVLALYKIKEIFTIAS